MRNEGTVSADKVHELVHLLHTGMFEEFMRVFKDNAREIKDEGPVVLVDLINKALQQHDSKSDMKLVVSQKTSEEKHLIMIMDNSRFWGDSFTITRQMFTV